MVVVGVVLADQVLEFQKLQEDKAVAGMDVQPTLRHQSRMV